MSLVTKRLLRILAVTVALTLLFVLLAMGAMFPRTKYAEGFSAEAFQAVQAGDTEAEVLRRLGPPLESYSEESAEQWCFDNQVSQLEPENKLAPLLGWPSAAECLFIDKGLVVGQRSSGNSRLSLFQGKSVAEVERQLGRPKSILPPGPKVVLRYSRQADVSANYLAHEVILDGERIVRGTDHYYDED